MVFSSLLFLFFYLPLFFLGYYLTLSRWRNFYITAGGILFYAWGAPTFIPLLLFSTTVDYHLSKAIFRAHEQANERRAKHLLFLSVLMNLGLLGYFKYANFFVEQTNWILSQLSLPSIPWSAVVLPIGISFSVFQELSYVIDVYRKKVRPARRFTELAAYLLDFATSIAGPIVRHIDVEDQLIERRESSEQFARGVQRFSRGLAKKVLIANPLSETADAIIHLNTVRDISSPFAWLGITAYAMQIYFDFSGYSDMAIGLGRMLGFEFHENFNMPYISKTITEFWRRWHISLSTWFREYVYIPLGGNRVSPTRTYINLWLVFLASGFWHGANWNFLIWGAFHGAFMVIDKLGWGRISERIPSFFTIPLTFITVLVSWVFFRIEDIGLAWRYLARMFAFPTWFEPAAIRWSEVIDRRGWVVLFTALMISFIPATSVYRHLAQHVQKLSPRFRFRVQSVSAILFFLLSVFALTNARFNPFIYYRF